MPKIAEKKSIFAVNLTRIRKKKGLSQKQLAELTGLSHRIIGIYETNISQVPIDKIGILAKALNVSPDDLLGSPKNNRNTPIFNDFSNTNMQTLKQLKQILLLTPENKKIVYKIVKGLLKIQELEDKNKIKQSQ